MLTVTKATAITLSTPPANGSGSYFFDVTNSGPVTNPALSWVGTQINLPTSIAAVNSGDHTLIQIVYSNGQYVGGAVVGTCAPVANGTGYAAASTGCPVSLTTNMISSAGYASGTGTANAQAVVLSPVCTALTAGVDVSWLPAAANTGATTLTVCGIAKPLVKQGSAALVANDLLTTQVAHAKYDGAANFDLQNPQTVSTNWSIFGTASSGGGAAGTVTQISTSQGNAYRVISSTGSNQNAYGVKTAVSGSFSHILKLVYYTINTALIRGGVFFYDGTTAQYCGWQSNSSATFVTGLSLTPISSGTYSVIGADGIFWGQPSITFRLSSAGGATTTCEYSFNDGLTYRTMFTSTAITPTYIGVMSDAATTNTAQQVDFWYYN